MSGARAEADTAGLCLPTWPGASSSQQTSRQVAAYFADETLSLTRARCRADMFLTQAGPQHPGSCQDTALPLLLGMKGAFKLDVSNLTTTVSLEGSGKVAKGYLPKSTGLPLG